jgi:hypothetical protein
VLTCCTAAFSIRRFTSNPHLKRAAVNMPTYSVHDTRVERPDTFESWTPALEKMPSKVQPWKSLNGGIPKRKEGVQDAAHGFGVGENLLLSNSP